VELALAGQLADSEAAQVVHIASEPAEQVQPQLGVASAAFLRLPSDDRSQPSSNAPSKTSSASQQAPSKGEHLS